MSASENEQLNTALNRNREHRETIRLLEKTIKAYEDENTPGFEEVCMRNQNLGLLLEKKQRLLELACEEFGHDWRGDCERCARCGVSDHLAQYTPCDDEQQLQAGA